MEWVKELIDYGVIGLLLLMSVVALSVAAERLMDKHCLPPTVLIVMAQPARVLMAHRSVPLPRPTATSLA